MTRKSEACSPTGITRATEFRRCARKSTESAVFRFQEGPSTASRQFPPSAIILRGKKKINGMSGTQTIIAFPVRKKCGFYGRKEEAKEDFTNATAVHTPSRYVPTVKKVVTLTSSESESDSDIENTTEKHMVTRDRRIENAGNTPRRRKCDKLDGTLFYFI